MNRPLVSSVIFAGVSFLLVAARAATIEPSAIERITGLKGALNGTVFKVTAPRNDVAVKVDGWTAPPFMGLTSWAAFSPGGKADAMVMGDFVLFQDEVAPAMKAALTHGLGVTALHNHFFFDEPHVLFMHVSGEGTPDMLAGGIRALLDAVASTRAASAQPSGTFGRPPLPATSQISAAPLEKILGVKIQANKGMAKAVIGRTVTMACGCEAGADMGINTWAAFAGADDNAVVDGDFAVTADELQPVLRSLTSAGINVVAIHHHMTEETPRLIFLHYWGRGAAADLANSIHAALALTKS
jgi:hypothetical protein